MYSRTLQPESWLSVVVCVVVSVVAFGYVWLGVLVCCVWYVCLCVFMCVGVWLCLGTSQTLTTHMLGHCAERKSAVSCATRAMSGNKSFFCGEAVLSPTVHLDDVQDQLYSI